MHISDSVYFQHIPKTGGTSLVKALYDCGKLPYDDAQNQWDIHVPILVQPLEELNNKFVFTIVRNPFDKLLSSYHYVVKGQFFNDRPTLKTLRQNSAITDITFKQWFSIVMWREKITVDDVNLVEVFPEAKYSSEKMLQAAVMHLNDMDLIATPFTTPQCNYFRHIDDITGPKKEYIPYVGKFECLEKSWKEISKKLGCDDKICLPHLLKRKHGCVENYRKFYTPEMKEKVFKFYNTDFEWFDYDW